jgi:hypothetical protein
MKPAALIALIIFCSCNNEQKPSALVKSSKDESLKPVTKPPTVSNPVVKYGIEGFYTGEFTPSKYDSRKEFFYNKITICIDSLNDKMVFGHSVVAGNSRPFSGSFVKTDEGFSVNAKEPGDNKYDGNFEFHVNIGEKKLTGMWRSNDPKLTVTERTYELESRRYKYDSSLQLPEDIAYEMIHGTYNSKTEKGEMITGDIFKKNPSSTLLKTFDVENMYSADLEVLRNSIYARHGYSFKNPRMRTVFDYVDWYMPVTTDVSSLLTEIEKKNIALIKRYEKHAEKYYDEFGR